MDAVRIADWPATTQALTTFFAGQGALEAGPDAVVWQSPGRTARFEVRRGGRVLGSMPLHAAQFTAEWLFFDGVQGTVRAEGDGVQYTFRRP